MEPLPTIPLRDLVLFPGTFQVLPVGRPSSLAAIDRHLEHGEPIVLVPQVEPDHEDPFSAELDSTGVLARVLRVTRLPDGTMRILVEGLDRVRVQGPLKEDQGCGRTTVEQVYCESSDPVALAAQARHLYELFQAYTVGTGIAAHEHQLSAADPGSPERLMDQVASAANLTYDERRALLSDYDLDHRVLRIVQLLEVLIAQQRLAQESHERVQEAMDKTQREYMLREQLKTIRAELGDALGTEGEADAFVERIRAAKMPEAAEKEALREVDRLRRLQQDSAEYSLLRTWLETLCDIPWSVRTADETRLAHAERVLEADHFGLEKVKERIIEYLAVRQLNPNSKGPILCFVGPPGVGKTSLGQSIARALGRAYARVALGGMKDESEIRGHRRTYVGAMPGRITRALIQAGSCNPVIVLDELDKVGNDFRGDPASALLEVLDPAQNNAFLDHYVDVPVDLSGVLFIATANLVDPIHPALRDRLELIEIPGYIEEEKTQIARRYLLPKLAEDHGLPGRVQFTEKAIVRVIRDYTREAGVRELDRQLAGVHRKVARKVVEGHEKRIRITDTNLPTYLGRTRYHQELLERVDQPGVVIGLAWTAAGGDILFIEAAKMPGTRSLQLTGSLGDVMKESAEAAMTWLRSNASQHGVGPDAFDSTFHLHVPAGAIPKDGPSAGVTMVTALASLVLGRTVRARLAMTGEITLRGKVLAVGGVKEKVLAARRVGVTDVILPAHNRGDVEDIPKALRDELKIHFVDNIEEVLNTALVAAVS